MQSKESSKFSGTPNFGTLPVQLRIVIWAAASAGLIYASIVIMIYILDGSYGRAFVFIRDPASQFGFPPFAGVVSTLGVFAMVATAAVCALVSLHISKNAMLLRLIAALTALIAADDFFELHERVLPSLGIPEYVVLAVYGLLAGLIGALFNAELRGLQHAGLHLAVGLLSLSVVFDVVDVYHHLILEDGFKFMGLCAWAAYWIERADFALARGHPAGERARY